MSHAILSACEICCFMIGLNPIKSFVEILLFLLINYSEGPIHCNTLGEREHVNRTEQNFYFAVKLGPHAGGI